MVKPLSGPRWLAVAALTAGLFLAGLESEAVFAGLARAWVAIFAALGLSAVLDRLQQGTSHLITMRNLPAVLTYKLLYVALSVLLLHVLLRDARRTRWVVQVYAGLLALCVLLLVGGRLSGHVAWAYWLGRHLIDFVVSPLPVLFVLPLLWPGRGRRLG